MITADLLSMLKVDLGITAKAYNDRLTEYLEAASADMSREGVQLEDTVEDSQLIVQYAAWLWRSRESGDAMPRMLRYRLNNRIFSQKMRGAENE